MLKSRLIREENASWIEKAVITRIWISTSDVHAENALEQLQGIFDTVLQESGPSLSAPATHAAQTLLWKKVEQASAQEQHNVAEAWCRLCLHSLFVKAGAQNKVKITRYAAERPLQSKLTSRLMTRRKIIQSALLRQDYAAARNVYCSIPEAGRDEPVTRYLMYKVGLRGGDTDFGKPVGLQQLATSSPFLAADCLDVVCRNSLKDATLLYACVLEAQSIGDKRQAIIALEKVLEKHEVTASVGLHLPALLR